MTFYLLKNPLINVKMALEIRQLQLYHSDKVKNLLL